jgi:hypothetical protein
MLGAAPGNVAENVVLETDRDSTVMFVEGAQHSYLGFVTLRFAPDVGASSAPHHKHYCLEVKDNSGPTVDHCIIRSLSAGEVSDLLARSYFLFTFLLPWIRTSSFNWVVGRLYLIKQAYCFIF